MTILVKVQRSIETTCEVPQMLVYDRRREKMGQFDLTQEWLDRFDHNGNLDDFKFFAEVDWPDQRLMPEFVRRARWRNW